MRPNPTPFVFRHNIETDLKETKFAAVDWFLQEQDKKQRRGVLNIQVHKQQDKDRSLVRLSALEEHRTTE